MTVNMSSQGSVTAWINLLKGGDPAAIQRLCEAPRRAADEEDVALSAFDSFCDGVAQGRFPQLTDRDDLWHVLVTITARKALQLIRHEQRQKRGGGAVRGESVFQEGADSDSSEEVGLDQIIGSEP